jgi:hypothetical protein
MQNYIVCDNCGLALPPGFICLGKKHEPGVCHKFVESGVGHFRLMTPMEKRKYKAGEKDGGAMRFNEKGELLFYPAWGYRRKKPVLSKRPRMRHGWVVA